MSYKIIVDSCGELTEDMKVSGYFETASLEIDVAGHHIIDDETFDQAGFLKLVASSPWNVPSHPAHLRKDICKDTAVMRISICGNPVGRIKRFLQQRHAGEESVS